MEYIISMISLMDQLCKILIVLWIIGVTTMGGPLLSNIIKAYPGKVMSIYPFIKNHKKPKTEMTIKVDQSYQKSNYRRKREHFSISGPLLNPLKRLESG